jgi:hypothetical protein
MPAYYALIRNYIYNSKNVTILLFTILFKVKSTICNNMIAARAVGKLLPRG